jgi:hypothetical protein
VTGSDSQAGESCVSFIATDEASVSDGDAGVAAGLDWQHAADATLFAQAWWARRHVSSLSELARTISGVLTNPTAIAIETNHRVHERRVTIFPIARLVPNAYRESFGVAGPACGIFRRGCGFLRAQTAARRNRGALPITDTELALKRDPS